MSRTVAALLTFAAVFSLCMLALWPREAPRLPSLPSYSSTVYDPR